MVRISEERFYRIESVRKTARKMSSSIEFFFSYLDLNRYIERLTVSDFIHLNQIEDDIFGDLAREIVHVRGSIDPANVVHYRRQRHASRGCTLITKI